MSPLPPRRAVPAAATLLLLLVPAGAGASPNPDLPASPVTRSSAGCAAYVVPANVLSLDVQAQGASGNPYLTSASGNLNGRGVTASGTVSVTPGQSVTLCVDQGGGSSGETGRGGGRASLATTPSGQPAVVAAGGGAYGSDATAAATAGGNAGFPGLAAGNGATGLATWMDSFNFDTHSGATGGAGATGSGGGAAGTNDLYVERSGDMISPPGAGASFLAAGNGAGGSGGYAIPAGSTPTNQLARVGSGGGGGAGVSGGGGGGGSLHAWADRATVRAGGGGGGYSGCLSSCSYALAATYGTGLVSVTYVVTPPPPPAPPAVTAAAPTQEATPAPAPAPTPVAAPVTPTSVPPVLRPVSPAAPAFPANPRPSLYGAHLTAASSGIAVTGSGSVALRVRCPKETHGCDADGVLSIDLPSGRARAARSTLATFSGLGIASGHSSLKRVRLGSDAVRSLQRCSARRVPVRLVLNNHLDGGPTITTSADVLLRIPARVCHTVLVRPRRPVAGAGFTGR